MLSKKIILTLLFISSQTSYTGEWEPEKAPDYSKFDTDQFECNKLRQFWLAFQMKNMPQEQKDLVARKYTRDLDFCGLKGALENGADAKQQFYTHHKTDINNKYPYLQNLLRIVPSAGEHMERSFKSTPLLSKAVFIKMENPYWIKLLLKKHAASEDFVCPQCGTETPSQATLEKHEATCNLN